jgi:hypothetical protein
LTPHTRRRPLLTGILAHSMGIARKTPHPDPLPEERVKERSRHTRPLPTARGTRGGMLKVITTRTRSRVSTTLIFTRRFRMTIWPQAA